MSACTLYVRKKLNQKHKFYVLAGLNGHCGIELSAGGNQRIERVQLITRDMHRLLRAIANDLNLKKQS